MQNVSNYNSLLRNTSTDFKARSGVPSELGVRYGGVNGTMEAEKSGGVKRGRVEDVFLRSVVGVTMLWLMIVG